MGMFDSVYVPCPKCTKPTEFQSKAGECFLTIYRLDNAPAVILADLYNQAGERCPECDHYFAVERPRVSNKDPSMVDKAWASIISSGVRAGQLWRHNKTDSTYRIVALSVDEARLVAVVTYEGHPNNHQRSWTRDLDVFLGKREDDGSFRFTIVGETP